MAKAEFHNSNKARTSFSVISSSTLADRFIISASSGLATAAGVDTLLFVSLIGGEEVVRLLVPSTKSRSACRRTSVEEGEAGATLTMRVPEMLPALFGTNAADWVAMVRAKAMVANFMILIVVEYNL